MSHGPNGQPPNGVRPGPQPPVGPPPNLNVPALHPQPGGGMPYPPPPPPAFGPGQDWSQDGGFGPSGDFGPAGQLGPASPISPPTRPPWQPVDGAPPEAAPPQAKPEPEVERPKPDYLVQSEDMYGGEMVAPSVIGQNDRYL